MLRTARVVRILPIAFLGLLTLSGGSAYARMTEKSWEVGGYYAYSRYSNNSAIAGENALGVRGSYAIRATSIIDFDVDAGSAPHQETDDITIDIRKFGVAYRHPFFLKGHDKVAPFFTGGLGTIFFDDGENSGRTNMYRAGGGFSYDFTPHLSFRFDLRIFRFHGIRDVGARPPVPGPEVTGMNPSGMYAFDVVLGMSYAFGGKK
jgi:amino acid transporter